MEYQHRRALKLESIFFIGDQELLARQRELRQMEHTRKALSEVSGITDRHILDKLMELEISPELLATLMVVPLLEVAWADGDVHKDEKKAVLDAAATLGMGCNSVDYAMLERWLTHRPPAKMLDAWKHYVAGLCTKLSESERAELKKDMVAHAYDVAKAAGGFLGLSSPISAKEKKVIENMESAFDLPK